MLKIQPFHTENAVRAVCFQTVLTAFLFLHFVQIFSLYQFQIPETVPDSIMEHIGRNMICQLLDLRGSISHSNLGGCIFKHSQVIVAVSDTTVSSHGISNRRITAAIPTALLKPFWNKLDGISDKRATALMTDDIIILT